MYEGMRGVAMTNRAADIEQLEYLLNNAGSFDELSDQAIVITKRLLQEVDGLTYIQRPSQRQIAKKELVDQATDLESVLEDIKTRKHPDALKKYMEFLNQKGLL